MKVKQINIYLLCILIGGFLLRLFYFDKIGIRGDESAYLYDSYLITRGERPLIDYHARTPIYLYYVSFFLFIFGNSIEAARLSSVVASTLTIYFIYVLVNRLYNQEAGLAASAIFAFCPYTVKYGVMLVPEVPLALILVISLIYLEKGLSTRKSRYLISAGIMIGLSIYIRRSAGLIILIVPLLIVFYHWFNRVSLDNSIKKILKRSIQESLVFILSFLAGVIPVFAFYLNQTSWDYMFSAMLRSAAGSGITIHLFPEYKIIINVPWLAYRAFIVISLFALFVFQLFKQLSKKSWHFQLLMPFLVFIIYYFISPYNKDMALNFLVFLTFSIAAIPETYIQKIKKEESHFYIFMMILVLLYGYIFILQLKYYQKFTAGLFIILLTYLFLDAIYAGLNDVSMKFVEYVKVRHTKISKLLISLGRLLTKPNYRTVVLIGLVLFLLYADESIYDDQEKFLLNLCYIFIFGLFLYLMKYSNQLHFKWGDTMVLTWFFVVFLFYANYGQFLDFYYYELIVPISMGSGIALSRLYQSIPRHEIKVFHTFITVLMVSVLVSNSLVININDQVTQKSIPSPEHMELVAHYLESVTDPGDVVFTACYAVIIRANLRVPMDISHAYYYRNPSVYISRELLGYPTLEELQEYLLEEEVRYSVIDPATDYYYFSKNPDFKTFFYDHYQLVKTFDQIEVYELNMN